MQEFPSEHAKEVSALWDAYRRGENERVPFIVACDEQVWLHVIGATFREFYTDPKVHLRAQLEGPLWFKRNVRSDSPPGLPERWDVGVQLWMEENDFFGCQVLYQEDDYAWALPFDGSKTELLEHLDGMDVEECIKKTDAFRMFESLKGLVQDLTFEDRPIRVHPPGGSTHGLFTKAVEIRGIEQLCMDLRDDPLFVDRFLTRITDRTIERIRAWHELGHGEEHPGPNATGFHFCDDSLQLISSEDYERFVLPHHERLYQSMTTGKRSFHVCGYAAQHFESLHRKLDVACIDGPGPFVDHARFFERLGPQFTFIAQVDHSVVAHGTDEHVEAMMKSILSEGAKIPGRFQLEGFLDRSTPLRKIDLCYEYAKKYGRVSPKKGLP